MYLAVKAACEQKIFPVQGPEMEEEQRARHREMQPRHAVQRNRELTINLAAAGSRARAQEHDERLRQVSKRVAHSSRK